MIPKNKISPEVKLLACDLMWKVCVLFLPLVNSEDRRTSNFADNAIPVFDQVEEEVELTLVCRCVGGLCFKNNALLPLMPSHQRNHGS